MTSRSADTLERNRVVFQVGANDEGFVNAVGLFGFCGAFSASETTRVGSWKKSANWRDGANMAARGAEE